MSRIILAIIKVGISRERRSNIPIQDAGPKWYGVKGITTKISDLDNSGKWGNEVGDYSI
jgi:hypothetical protein